MAQVKDTIDQWSTTASSNSPSGSDQIGTGLDDNLREIQKVVKEQFSTGTIAAAVTTNLSGVNNRQLTVTGTGVTITSFGTLEAGAYKILSFEGANTITHNATSMIMPNGEDFATNAGDSIIMYSLGSGNWECIMVNRAAGNWESPQAANRTRLVNGATTDLNTLTAPGIYSWHTAAPTNAPVDAASAAATAGLLIVEAPDGSNIHQFAFSGYQSGGGMWLRRYSAGAWGAWERMAQQSDVDAHSSATTGVHGVTGTVLGTEDYHNQGASKIMGARSSVTNADYNTLTYAGCYRLSTGTTNGPSGNPSYNTLLTLRGPGADTAAQIAFPYTSSKMWFRSDNGASDGSWSVSNPWRTVATLEDAQTFSGSCTFSQSVSVADLSSTAIMAQAGNNVLDVADIATASVAGSVSPKLTYALFSYQASSGTAGGTPTAGSWWQRPINTVDTNGIGASLSSNQITLPAGYYIMHIQAAGYDCSGHQIRLRNVTDGTYEYGTSMHGHDGSPSQTYSRIDDAFSFTTSKTIRIEHNFEHVSTTPTTYTSGRPAARGVNEKYLIALFIKIR